MVKKNNIALIIAIIVIVVLAVVGYYYNFGSLRLEPPTTEPVGPPFIDWQDCTHLCLIDLNSCEGEASTWLKNCIAEIDNQITDCYLDCNNQRRRDYLDCYQNGGVSGEGECNAENPDGSYRHSDCAACYDAATERWKACGKKCYTDNQPKKDNCKAIADMMKGRCWTDYEACLRSCGSYPQK